MITKYQEQYNALHLQLEKLEKELKKQNLFINEGQVLKDYETYGIFWEITYIYDNVGDGIFLCHHSKGAIELDETDYQKILKARENSTFDKLKNILEYKTTIHPDVFDELENQLSNLKIQTEVIQLDLDTDYRFSERESPPLRGSG